jgi:hypothetical protein
LAIAAAAGLSGSARSEAYGYSSNSEFYAGALATHSVGSTAHTEAWSSGVGEFRDAALGAGNEAFAYVATNATDAEFANFVGGNVDIQSGFQGAQWIGAGVMGGGFPEDGTDGTDHWGTITTTFHYSPWDGQHDGKYLVLGLFDGDLQGFAGANDQWTLTVNAAGANYYNSWDSSTHDFADLFADNLLNLGQQESSWSGWSVDVQFSWNTADAASNFQGSFALGFSAVPEPSSALLLGLGCSLFVLRRSRRQI